MPYDSIVEERLDALLDHRVDFDKRHMFGGIGYLLNGHMCVGIWHDNLIVRCGPARWTELLAGENVLEFDITGRSMKGWIMVEPMAFGEDHELADWLALAEAFVGTLPPK